MREKLKQWEINYGSKRCISIKFSEDLSIFCNHYGYPEMDQQEKYNGTTDKDKDIQDPQAYAWHDFLIPNRKSLDFDIDDYQYFIKPRET